MNGTLIDMTCIIIGATLGAVSIRALKMDEKTAENVENLMYRAIGLACLLASIPGISSAENAIVCIISIILGAAVGHYFDVDAKLHTLTAVLSRFMKKIPGFKVNVEGIKAYTIISLSGSLAITGPITNVLNHDPSAMLTKGALDAVCSFFTGIGYGASVALSSIFVFLYQAFFAGLAYYLTPLLTPAAIGDMDISVAVQGDGESYGLGGIVRYFEPAGADEPRDNLGPAVG